MFKRKPIVLALGGGGARGFAHIGVLRVLEREKIPIHRIIGTSMGAVVGGIYSQKPDVAALEEKFRHLLASPSFKSSGMLYVGKKRIEESWFDQFANHVKEQIVVNVASFKKSVVTIDRLYSALDVLLKDEVIEKTVLPFAAVASDLLTGEEVVISYGPIRDAVAASAAIPGFFPPTVINGRQLIDGAATSAVPVKAARSLAKRSKIVAVDVSSNLSQKPKLDNILDIVLRSHSITARCYHDEMIKGPDYLIQPDVGDFHWSEFVDIDRIIKKGEMAAEVHIDGIIKGCKFGFF